MTDEKKRETPRTDRAVEELNLPMGVANLAGLCAGFETELAQEREARARLREALTWAVGFITCNCPNRDEYPDFANAKDVAQSEWMLNGPFWFANARAEKAEAELARIGDMVCRFHGGLPDDDVEMGVSMACERAEKAESQLSAARAALSKHGKHDEYCRLDYGDGCTCGYQHAIEQIGGESCVNQNPSRNPG